MTTSVLLGGSALMAGCASCRAILASAQVRFQHDVKPIRQQVLRGRTRSGYVFWQVRSQSRQQQLLTINFLCCVSAAAMLACNDHEYREPERPSDQPNARPRLGVAASAVSR